MKKCILRMQKGVKDMYSLTLEINQRCNLKCRYCYLGDKNGDKMEIQTAKKAIDMAFQKVKLHKDHKLWVDFVGGEALLDFKMIEMLVEYIEKKNLNEHNELLFSVTTNATVFNKEIINFLIEKQFALKVSIDGNKEINDRNRISCTGYSVHDKIMENLKYVRSFEERTGRYVQVTNVITENNYESYFESLVYLTKTLGFKMIDTALDLSVPWNNTQMEILSNEIKKSFRYFIEQAKKQNGFYWEFAEKVIKFRDPIIKNSTKKFYCCGAGIVSAYIRTDGTIFACPGNLEETVCLGNLDKGFKKEKMLELKNFNGIDNEECANCEIADYCVERSCMMQNIAVTGDKNKPAPIFCRMRRLMFELYQENEDIIKRINM